MGSPKNNAMSEAEIIKRRRAIREFIILFETLQHVPAKVRGRNSEFAYKAFKENLTCSQDCKHLSDFIHILFA